MVTRAPVSFEDRVGQVLLEGGFLNNQQLAQAREESGKNGAGLLDTLLSTAMISQETLVTVLSFRLRIPVVDLRHVQVDPKAAQLLPEQYARQYSVLPVGFDTDNSLRIATRMPNDFRLSTELTSVTGRQTKFVLAMGGRLEDLIGEVYAAVPGQRAAPEPENRAAAATITRVEPTPAGTLLGQDISQLPAMQSVDIITLQAVKRRASDIHLVAGSDSARVLFRLDGILQEMILLPISLHETMISRIKVLAGMDISETRRPQDGSFSMDFGEKKVEFRVSTVGTTWGEMMVIRILDRSSGLLSLEDLGLDSSPLNIWRQLMALPYGMVMVSGPTGCGKTTTLYASVVELIKDRGNIMTVEDPIEYRLDGINQIRINRAAGIDFPAGLRSIMRLDPDVILVGEIRDAETAKTAIDAALTGHLVLASIHSNDAASSLVRLLDLKVEPFLAATGVIGALAQRLVRKVCNRCAVLADATATEAMAYEQEMQEPAGQFMLGRGCNFCNGTGFSGRTGVFEVMSVDDSIRKLIASGAGGQQIRAQTLLNGMVPMRHAGILKAKEGITTIGEVLRGVFFIE